MNKENDFRSDLKTLTGVDVKTDSLEELIKDPRAYVDTDQDYEKIMSVLNLLEVVDNI